MDGDPTAGSDRGHLGVGLSLGWTGGSVLAGEPLVEYLPLVATIAAVGAVLFVVRDGE